ncbi:MAG: hypothetical protein LBO71_04340 [Prevotellaceae bacterium]|jgi:hypothetical protein|nr:hypothetical protein [Prevotellaceae bacterium]
MYKTILNAPIINLPLRKFVANAISYVAEKQHWFFWGEKYLRPFINKYFQSIALMIFYATFAA